jgi:hypothetical protein
VEFSVLYNSHGPHTIISAGGGLLITVMKVKVPAEYAVVLRLVLEYKMTAWRSRANIVCMNYQRQACDIWFTLLVNISAYVLCIEHNSCLVHLVVTLCVFVVLGICCTVCCVIVVLWVLMFLL